LPEVSLAIALLTPATTSSDTLEKRNTCSNDILMSENNTFRRTCTSRSVHDTGNVNRTRRRGIHWVVGAKINEIIVRNDCLDLTSFGESPKELFIRFTMINDDTQIGNRRENFSEVREERRTSEYCFGFGFGERMC
jgi:hypothetical protein